MDPRGKTGTDTMSMFLLADPQEAQGKLSRWAWHLLCEDTEGREASSWLPSLSLKLENALPSTKWTTITYGTRNISHVPKWAKKRNGKNIVLWSLHSEKDQTTEVGAQIKSTTADPWEIGVESPPQRFSGTKKKKHDFQTKKQPIGVLKKRMESVDICISDHKWQVKEIPQWMNKIVETDAMKETHGCKDLEWE